MRSYLTIAALALALAATCSAQTKRTEETKTEIATDTTNGKVVTLSTVTTIANTEDITPRTYMITSDPVKFWQFYNISYYQAITPHIVVGGGIQVPTALADRSISGFGVNMEARFYLSGKPFRGFHLNPILSINSLSYESYNWEGPGNVRVKDTPVSLGLLMGWHWYPWEEFGTQIAFGAEYNFSATTEQNLIGLGSDRIGLVPAAHIAVGYSW